MASHGKLMCQVSRIEYNFDTKIGAVFMPEHNCTDMAGCIALFKGIDPQVLTIKTYAGGVADTMYMRSSVRVRWLAKLP